MIHFTGTMSLSLVVVNTFKKLRNAWWKDEREARAAVEDKCEKLAKGLKKIGLLIKLGFFSRLLRIVKYQSEYCQANER